MRRRFLLASGFGWAALSGAAFGAANADLYRDPDRWLDDRSQPFVLEQLRGHASVLTMAYGACRRICSTSLRVLEQAQRLADERGVALEFVVVGLDAALDKPADWAEFRAERRLTRANWHFLAGDDDAVRRLAAQLGVRYWHVDEHVMHDFKITLVGEDGVPRRALQNFDDPVGLLMP